MTSNKSDKPVQDKVSLAAQFKDRKPNPNSVSFKTYKELKSKDKNTLSQRELKQLETVEKQMQQLADKLASNADFVGIVQSLNTALPKISNAMAVTQHFANYQIAPALRAIAAANTSIIPAIEAIKVSSLYTKGQLEALASIQKSISNLPLQRIANNYKSIIEAPLIARTMFADFHTKHLRVMRDLTVDLSSLTATIEFSRSETIDLSVGKVSNKDTLTADMTATQSTEVGGITYTDSADMQLVINELQATRQEVAELKQIIKTNNTSDTPLLLGPSNVSFQRTTSSLKIGPYEVKVILSSKQAQFARTLVSSPENITKKWDVEDLIFQAFGERIENEENWIAKIRSYIHQLNQKVLRDSNGQVDDFFVLDGIYVYVNPKYFNL